MRFSSLECKVIVCCFFTKLHDFVRKVANILAGDINDSVLCSDCVKRMASMQKHFIDSDTLSETSGFGSECTSENEDEDDDINQLRLLVEITTGRRIYPVTQERSKTFHAPERDKAETSKRKKKHFVVPEVKKSKKKEKKGIEHTVDEKTARISAKFKEIEIKSANAAKRKTKHKSA